MLLRLDRTVSQGSAVSDLIARSYIFKRARCLLMYGCRYEVLDCRHVLIFRHTTATSCESHGLAGIANEVDLAVAETGLTLHGGPSIDIFYCFWN